MLIHFIVICFVLSVLLYYYGFVEYFLICTPGNFFYFLDYFFIFCKVNIVHHFNYYTIFGHFLLFDWFKYDLISQFFPEKRFYFFEQFAGFKAQILTNYFADLYLILSDGHILTGWYLHLMYNPGMPLLWLLIICFLVILYFYIIKFIFNLKKKNFSIW